MNRKNIRYPTLAEPVASRHEKVKAKGDRHYFAPDLPSLPPCSPSSLNRNSNMDRPRSPLNALTQCRHPASSWQTSTPSHARYMHDAPCASAVPTSSWPEPSRNWTGAVPSTSGSVRVWHWRREDTEARTYCLGLRFCRLFADIPACQYQCITAVPLWIFPASPPRLARHYHPPVPILLPRGRCREPVLRQRRSEDRRDDVEPMMVSFWLRCGLRMRIRDVFICVRYSTRHTRIGSAVEMR
jgi:hypothetical protein